MAALGGKRDATPLARDDADLLREPARGCPARWAVCPLRQAVGGRYFTSTVPFMLGWSPQV